MPDLTICIDESGDPGSSSRSGKFLSVGCAIVRSDRFMVENESIRRFLNKTNGRIRGQKNKIDEFRFSANKADTKNKFMKFIANMDVDIMAFYAEKGLIDLEILREPTTFYKKTLAYAITHAIGEYCLPDSHVSVKLIIDQSFRGTRTAELEGYYREEINRYAAGLRGGKSCDVTVLHANSKAVKMIQVADYVVGSVQRKLKLGDSGFFDMLGERIKRFEKIDDGKIDW